MTVRQAVCRPHGESTLVYWCRRIPVEGNRFLMQ